MGFNLKRLFGGGDNGQAKQNQYAEIARQMGIQNGTNAINSLFDNQFNDDFFTKRRQSALDYYMPQLDQQYADAQKQLEFALARAGGSESSASAQQRADLQQRYGTNRQAVADKALGYETNARDSIEQARASLLSALHQTGDEAGTVNAATARVSSLGRPDTYEPLADLFTTGTSLFNQQSALEKANIASQGEVQPRFWTGIHGERVNRRVANT